MKTVPSVVVFLDFQNGIQPRVFLKIDIIKFDYLVQNLNKMNSYLEYFAPISRIKKRLTI